MEAIEKGIGGSGARAATRCAVERSIFKEAGRQPGFLDNGSGKKAPSGGEARGEVLGEETGRRNPDDQRGEFAGPDDPDPTPHAAPINREQGDVDDVKRFTDSHPRCA